MLGANDREVVARCIQLDTGNLKIVFRWFSALEVYGVLGSLRRESFLSRV